MIEERAEHGHAHEAAGGTGEPAAGGGQPARAAAPGADAPASRSGTAAPTAGAVPLRERLRLRPTHVVVLLAILGCGLLTVLVDPVLGVMALAGLLAVAGVARLVLPARWLDGLTVRSRGIDVATLLLLAAGIAVLAQTAPSL